MFGNHMGKNKGQIVKGVLTKRMSFFQLEASSGEARAGHKSWPGHV